MVRVVSRSHIFHSFVVRLLLPFIFTQFGLDCHIFVLESYLYVWVLSFAIVLSLVHSWHDTFHHTNEHTHIRIEIEQSSGTTKRKSVNLKWKSHICLLKCLHTHFESKLRNGWLAVVRGKCKKKFNMHVERRREATWKTHK